MQTPPQGGEWREAGWGSADYILHVACMTSAGAEAGLKSVLCLYGRGNVSKWTLNKNRALDSFLSKYHAKCNQEKQVFVVFKMRFV